MSHSIGWDAAQRGRGARDRGRGLAGVPVATGPGQGADLHRVRAGADRGAGRVRGAAVDDDRLQARLLPGERVADGGGPELGAAGADGVHVLHGVLHRRGGGGDDVRQARHPPRDHGEEGEADSAQGAEGDE